MKTFFTEHTTELLWSAIILVVLFVFRFLATKMVRKIGKISDIVEARTLLISKYVSFLATFLGIGALTFIWGVNFREIGLLFSSIFAVIGVALFAQWSILSNVTSGVILFFSFPFKIGDRIRIMDKELITDEAEGPNIFFIEDIKAYHILLRNSKGELITYPNNMMLQKAVTLLGGQHEDTNEGSDVL
ncbi:mechanosensitive ion channel family protein [Flavobacteriaceae bacterium TP-CH-4]|uniref:Mechanosensitive ion channel family protein n=1 Tax=Pelagihabitans pacificus TaxID=2696054 RepID=A0A967AUI5_9FLAO|nr:mechanosensitive ion channel family protein [Pelagihabitans pacificus]NHF60249.1 mechanosensitive ion channel family protein [Pelagihabitans pacificus]